MCGVFNVLAGEVPNGKKHRPTVHGVQLLDSDHINAKSLLARVIAGLRIATEGFQQSRLARFGLAQQNQLYRARANPVAGPEIPKKTWNPALKGR